MPPDVNSREPFPEQEASSPSEALIPGVVTCEKRWDGFVPQLGKDPPPQASGVRNGLPIRRLGSPIIRVSRVASQRHLSPRRW